MNCEELAQILPDLVDGTLTEEQRVEAEAALPQCPECQQELEIVRQVRAFMVRLQAEYADIRIPAGFEARLLAKVRAQYSSLEFLDLSSTTFALWLVEFLNLIAGLIDPRASQPRPGTAS
ncbi:MAG: anti-sigma factor family protein [Ktedonobacteraceae bacterium]